MTTESMNVAKEQRQPRIVTDARGHNIWVGEFPLPRQLPDPRHGMQLVGKIHALTSATPQTSGVLELLEPQGYDPYDSTRRR